MERHSLGTGWDEDLTDANLDIRLARLKDRASHMTPIEDAADLEEAIEQAAGRIADHREAGQDDRPPGTVIRYRISSQVPGLRGHAVKVVFTADQACIGAQVRVVAFSSDMVPGNALQPDGILLLETTLALRAGVPADFMVSVPKSVKRPFWVRCFCGDQQVTCRSEQPDTRSEA